ncbi:MAG: PAS domain-containing protein, partial [Verrucomicrobiae bacterium]|nr:PAS domain-containing protein [Verrucomicrobiae bacterium]
MIRATDISIRLKLTVLVALVVVVLAGGLSLVSYIFARRILSEQIEERLEVVASDRRQLLRSHLQRHKERVESAAARLGVALLNTEADGEALTAELVQALRVERLTTSGEVQAIWLWDEEGRVLAVEPADLGEEPAGSIPGIRTTVLTAPKRSGFRYTLEVAAPVVGRQGRGWGLGMRVEVTALMLALSDPVGLGETGEVRLVVPSARGWRFVVPDRLGRPIPDVRRDRDASWRGILGEAETVGTTRDDRGVSVLAAYLPMPELGWGVLAKMDAQEAYAPIAWLRQMFIAVETTVFVLGVLAAFFVGRRVSRPIQQLAAAARDLAGGKMTPLPEVGGSAEVAALGRAFGQMAEEVAHAQAALEQRVRERTAALEQANEALQREIAERRRAEENLRQQQMLLQSLMDNIPDCIYFKDEHSRFIKVNRAFGKWCGVSPDEVVGKTDFHIFTAEHAQQAFDDEKEVMRTGQPLIAKEEKETWPDGRITWVSSTKLPLRDADGRIIGTFGVSRDITARKLAELRLERYAKALAQRTMQTQEDLALAREIQVAFLPRNLPNESDRVRVAYEYRPASTLGGDFFDVWRVGERSW